MIELTEHDRVVLTTDFSSEHLAAGDVGTVVHVYEGRKAYEVEFVALDGQTIAIITVEADQIRPVRHREITHARHVA